MRNLSHVTPNYLMSKAKIYYFNFRNNNAPWLTQSSIQIIQQLLKDTDLGIEFGSGRSTSWLIQRSKNLISIETNEDWFKKITSVNKDAIESGKIKLHLIQNKRNLDTLLSEIPDHSLDYALVDSNYYRDVAAAGVVRKIKLGGFIVVDNAERYLPSKSNSPEAVGENHILTDEWINFNSRTAAYRRIWTTNGVWDTAIFFII